MRTYCVYIEKDSENMLSNYMDINNLTTEEFLNFCTDKQKVYQYFKSKTEGYRNKNNIIMLKIANS